MEIYDQYLITKIQNHFAGTETVHEKKSFWPTDAGKPLFDLYHAWIGTKPTNPIEAEKLIMFGAAKAYEASLVKILGEMGLVHKTDSQERIEMTRHGVPVSGYMDAVFIDNTPLEIKSFYGNYQAKDLTAGKPSESYLKQLSVYMDFKGAERGKLVYADRGTGQMFEFTLVREGSKYKCLNIEFDLEDIYSRWAKLYNENIIPRVEPESEFRYKIPLDEIDWSKISKSEISKARNNKKVIGDHPWAVNYSSYKNLIVEKEGTCLGYSLEELEKIKEMTAGYSSKKFDSKKSNIY